MNNILSLCLLLLSTGLQAQNLYRSGLIAAEEVWEADTVFVTDTLRIGPDGRLHIQPGVTVVFDNQHPMYCDGRFYALGTADAPILFTNTDTVGLYEPEGGDGGWRGIWFINSDSTHIDSSRFEHCVFRYAKPHPFRSGGALRFDSWQAADIKNCTFSHNVTRVSGAAILMVRGWIRIDSCVFKHNRTLMNGGAVSIRAHKSYITNCVFMLNDCYTGNFYACTGEGAAAYIARAIPINTLEDWLGDTTFCHVSGNLVAFNSSCGSNFIVDAMRAEVFNNIFYNNVNGGLDIYNNNKPGNRAVVAYNTFINNTDYGPMFYTDNIIFTSNILWNNGMDIIGGQEFNGLSRPNGNGDFFPELFSHNIVKGGSAQGENTLDEMPEFVSPPQYIQPGYHPVLFMVPVDTTGFHLVNFRPTPYSPTVDNGYPYTQTYLDVPYDMYGLPRKMGQGPDIGATELPDYAGLPTWEPQPGFTVYPNPCLGDRFWINSQTPVQQATLTDVYGRIYRLTASGGGFALPPGLAPGTYTVRVGMGKTGGWAKLLVVKE